MLFVRAGGTDPDVNRLVAYTGGGLVFRGLLRGPEGDRLGIGVAAAHNSLALQAGAARAESPVEDTEIALQLTYAVEVGSWLTIQPDIQYIIDPGMQPALDNARVLGLRIRLRHQGAR